MALETSKCARCGQDFLQLYASPQEVCSMCDPLTDIERAIAEARAASCSLAVRQLERLSAIMVVVEQMHKSRRHGHCFMDIVSLFKAAGLPVECFEPLKLPRDSFLKHCADYHAQMSGQATEDTHRFCEQCGDCVTCFAGDSCPYGGTH